MAELAGLAVLAVLDSVNPTAIAITLYLLARHQRPAPAVVYIGAIAATYFVLGLLMLSGVQSLAPSAGDLLDSRGGLVVQGAIGAALLAYALRSSKQSSAPVAPPATGAWAALIVLGMTVTAMELPTAVPYFAAIAILTSMELPLAGRALLLGVYNVIFVLPPLVLVTGHYVTRGALDARYADLRARIERTAGETASWIAGLVGGALLVTSIIELVARL